MIDKIQDAFTIFINGCQECLPIGRNSERSQKPESEVGIKTEETNTPEIKPTEIKTTTVKTVEKNSLNSSITKPMTIKLPQTPKLHKSSTSTAASTDECFNTSLNSEFSINSSIQLTHEKRVRNKTPGIQLGSSGNSSGYQGYNNPHQTLHTAISLDHPPLAKSSGQHKNPKYQSHTQFTRAKSECFTRLPPELKKRYTLELPEHDFFGGSNRSSYGSVRSKSPSFLSRSHGESSQGCMSSPRSLETRLSSLSQNNSDSGQKNSTSQNQMQIRNKYCKKFVDTHWGYDKNAKGKKPVAKRGGGPQVDAIRAFNQRNGRGKLKK